MKLCLETAGSSLDDVLKCNVYCTSVEKFAAVNAGLVWHPDAPSARRARWLRHALLVVLGIAAAIAVILHYFGGSILGA